jgi:transcriptional regulator with XRE-family HTH domain
VPADEPPPTLETVLGASLKEARKESGKTQADAAVHLDVTHSAIGQWERGLTLPSLTNLINIAELYGASLDGLIWNMQNRFDARLRVLPAGLRSALQQRWQEDLEEAERAAKKFPELAKALDTTARPVLQWSELTRKRKDKLS